MTSQLREAYSARHGAKSETPVETGRFLKGDVAMKSTSVFALFLLLSLAPLTGAGYNDRDNTLVRFKGGIGVDPISNVTVSGRNYHSFAKYCARRSSSGPNLEDRRSHSYGEGRGANSSVWTGLAAGRWQRHRNERGAECLCYSLLRACLQRYCLQLKFNRRAARG